MTTEIPKALTVLDLFISVYVDGQIPESDQEAIRKVRAAFAAEHEALKDARMELANLPHSLAYSYTHLPKIDKAIAAVEKLK